MIHPTGTEILQPSLIWRDGSLIAFAGATTHVLSHVSARGSQIFDVLLVVTNPDGPSALGLREHVARFVRSAETMGMEGLPALAEIEQAVANTVMANLSAAGIDPAASGPLVVKLIASWDDPSQTVVPASRVPTIYVAVTPWASTPEKAATLGDLPEPIKVKTASMPKIPASVLPPSMKVAAGYTPGLRHHLMAVDEGFDHVVFRTQDGDLAESVTSSFFVIKDGRISVPPVDTVLDGITRRALLDVAQALDVPYQVRPVAWDQVTGADELFMTSTIKAVVPVAQLDEVTLDAPGPITAELSETMALVLAGKHELTGRWMTPMTGFDSAG